MQKGLKWFVYFLAGLNLLNFIDNYILSAVGAYLQKDLGLTDAQLGAVGAAFVWGFLLVSPFVGWINRKIKTSTLIGGSVLLWSVALAMIGIVGNLFSILMLRFLGGMGQGVFYTLAPVIINDHIEAKQRNQAFAIFYLALPLGTALGFLIGGALALTIGWQLAFAVAGLFGVPLAIAGFSFGQLRTKSPKRRHYIHEVIDLLKSKRYLSLVLGSGAQSFAIAGFAFWSPIYMNRMFGFPVAQASILFGLLLIAAGAIGDLSGGKIAAKLQAKYGEKGLMNQSIIAVAMAFATSIAAVATHNVWIFFIALAIATLLIFASFAPYTTLFFASIPQLERTTGSGISNAFSRMFGDMMGIWLVGFLSVELGGLDKAFYLLPAVLFLNLMAWTLCRCFNGRTPRSARAR